MAIGIVGSGSYLPARVVTNMEIAAWAETSADWILSGTRIEDARPTALILATMSRHRYFGRVKQESGR
jgi:3-oxoacyl-[acyl-carrier-protein] synthase III